MAAFMANSQVPWGVAALIKRAADKVSVAAN
jgi:hypothetical protein